MGISSCKSICLNVKDKDLEFIDEDKGVVYQHNKSTKKDMEIFNTLIQGSKSKNKKPNEQVDDIIIDGNMLINKLNGSINETYKRSKKLGEGSYGSVFLVDHLRSGQKRAMKIIQKRSGDDENAENEEEIMNEIEILKKMDHPNIVKIFEFFNSKNNFYLITEFCKEGELFEKIIEEGPFDEEFTSYIMYQIFSAVYYCHSMNILHRDLKPENILLEKKEEFGLKIKIIDFGTAKLFDKNKVERKVIGSSYYIAPEVLSKSYNEKCDLWSCGVIMYILLSGAPPFGGKGDTEIMNKIKKGVYDLDNSPWEKVSDDAKNLIKSLLEKNVEKRITADKAMNHSWFKKMGTKRKINFVENDKILKMLIQLTSYSPDKFLQQISIAYLVHNFPQHECVQEANKLFNMIDTNSNGQINQEELEMGIKKLIKNENVEMEEMVKNVFANIDGDKNGYIEHEEFVRGCIDKSKFITEDIIKFSFDFFDKDKNGEITCEEIEEILLRNIKKDINSYKNSVKKMISEIDIDNDGKISYDEFRKMMNNLLKQ